jgi:hypothetical protein
MIACKTRVKKRGVSFSQDVDEWAISILLECHAVQRCPDHGYIRDLADPHSRSKAQEAARAEPYPGLTPRKSAEAIEDALRWIGDRCPEC